MSKLIEFEKHFNEKTIKITNPFLDKIIKKMSFLLITQNDFNFQNIIHRENASKIIAIDKYNNEDEVFYIICFGQTIIMLNDSLLEIFIQNHNESTIFILFKGLNMHTNKIINIQEISKKEDFTIMIDNFSYELQSTKSKNDDYLIWKKIRESVSCFFIMKSFIKLNSDRIQNFEYKEKIERKNEFKLKDNEFIILKDLSSGNSSRAQLIYHIEKEELFLLKSFIGHDSKDLKKLIHREYINYINIQHPFLPAFYGMDDQAEIKYLIIEYINGQTLFNIQNMNLNINDKLKIIFELIIVFEYLHNKGFIYRDLKPNNVIIDRNKNAVLIDFDRMIFEDDVQETKDFVSDYVAPEISTQNCSKDADIYSLGILIYFILFEKHPNMNNYKFILKEFEKDCKSDLIYQILKMIYYACIKKEPKERPLLSSLIDIFFKNFLAKIPLKFPKPKFNYSAQNACNDRCFPYWLYVEEYDDISLQKELGIKYENNNQISQELKKKINFFSLASNQNHYLAQFYLGNIYENEIHDINKSIYYYSLSANQGYSTAQCCLGSIYTNDAYKVKDIGKAVHYFTLAANQNVAIAQHNLGIIYEANDQFKNIDKAIFYYTLAANQNVVISQHNLGVILYDNKFNRQNIVKAIHYLTLAANQNIGQSQCQLGFFYFENIYTEQDINKSVYYFTLSAKQNIPESQYFLGIIYSDKKYGIYDIKKAIYYYSLAADQNFAEAQHNLGILYSNGVNFPRNIDISIYYFTLAANQNFLLAQNNLGIIYSDKIYNRIDIEKSIDYFTQAAKQNYASAQYNLGIIYYSQNYGKHDINKSIYYFKLAAKQNYVEALNDLACIYSENKYVQIDINKAIRYYTTAANLNNAKAQCCLGHIYLTSKHVTNDINKSIFYFELAANQNYAEALYQLGLLYYKDECIPKDINKAIHYLSLASNQNHMDAQYLLGVIFYSSEEYENIEKAIHYFTLAANQNHSYAKYLLSNIYLSNEHSNIKEALRLLHFSAQQNEIMALYTLGEFYYQGKYVNKDIKKALYYLHRAADFNESNAQNLLGDIYYSGKYIKKDLKKGLYYLKQSSDQCNIKAMFNMAIYSCIYNYEILNDADKSLYCKEYVNILNDPSKQYRLGAYYLYLCNDANKAIHYFENAAHRDHLESIVELGRIYLSRKYHKKNIDKAIYYFQLSAKHQDNYSILILGLIFATGYGVKIDFDKSIGYLKQLELKGNVLSLFTLGCIYSDLLPENKKDIKQAIYYYTLAMNKNHLESIYNLGMIYYKGNKVQKDIKKAIYYFEIASNQNYSKAKYNLGYIYLFNKDIKTDINKGLNYIKKAEEQNEKNTIFILGILYYQGHFVPRDIKKSIKYLTISALNKIANSYYLLGVVYSEKVTRNKKLSIKFYKESTSLNNQYAKNNLALIYKNGYGIDKNINYSITYLNEAIQQKNDPCAMYNLANIYFYFFNKFDESIDLLIKSIEKDFWPSKELLCLVLIEKYNKIQIEDFEMEIKRKYKYYEELISDLFVIIKENDLYNFSNYIHFYEYLYNVEYEYDFFQNPFESTRFAEQNEEIKLRNNIDSFFYEGFGLKS